MWSILKKILIGLGTLITALILFIVISIPIAGIGSENRLGAVTNVTIPGSPDVKVYIAKPEGEGPFPTVIMIHEFFGLNESITGKADGLAAEGYYVIAPDTFRGSTTGWIPRAIWQVISNDSDQVNLDLDTVTSWLETQPEVDPDRIAIAGFCYGGRASLLYSLHNPNIAATVVFYGSAETDPAVLKNLPGPVLGIFGGADVSIPLEEVLAFDKGLEAAGIPHEITVYENQPHAFVTDMDSIRKGGAQGEAWNQMLTFLDANLKNKKGTHSSGSITYDAPFNWQYYLLLAYEHAFGSASGHH